LVLPKVFSGREISTPAAVLQAMGENSGSDEGEAEPNHKVSKVSLLSEDK